MYSTPFRGRRSLSSYLSAEDGRFMSPLSEKETDSHPTQDTDSDTFFSAEEYLSPSPRRRARRPASIQWPDQVGQELEIIHPLHDDLEPATVRIVVFLVNSKEKKYEFVHCEFCNEQRLLVSDVLQQLKFTSVLTQWESFDSLIREKSSEKLRDTHDLTSYALRDGEILIATSGCKSKDGTKYFKSVTKKHGRFLRKAVKKARIQGRALQCLFTSAQWAEVASSQTVLRKFAIERSEAFGDFGYKSSEDEGDFKGSSRGGFLSRKVLREFQMRTKEALAAKEARRQKWKERNRKFKNRIRHFPMVMEWYRVK
ncbi:hypothetical protein FisN_13Hh123 [Fistulifera solaris]|uniref:Ubiquitin-like domain-containing protein n=1 Tax=Fistulifera solaris TaxID=1519565 RepID=A0A1Z5KN82_FISSO|nr:hypothetical protein FisN_13Hh123 [Fistulifera solaris]|eukprot:GAX27774.1 hypothetical protein FisN_13Hh123 [Fistulifera solaris]